MKSIEVNELRERLSEVMRQVQEQNESVDVTDAGEVIAHLVPAYVSHPAKQDISAMWLEFDKLSAEIGRYITGKVDAVEIIRDVRRDL